MESIQNNPVLAAQLMHQQQQQNVPADPITSSSRDVSSRQNNENLTNATEKLPSMSILNSSNKVILNSLETATNGPSTSKTNVPLSDFVVVLNGTVKRQGDDSTKNCEQNSKRLKLTSGEFALNVLRNKEEEVTNSNISKTSIGTTTEKIVETQKSLANILQSPPQNSITAAFNLRDLEKTQKTREEIVSKKIQQSNNLEAACTQFRMFEDVKDIKPNISLTSIESNSKNSQVNLSINKQNNLLDNQNSEESPQDQWDDYCYVCNQGCDDESGVLGCCNKCPHVFHNMCHIPTIPVKMNELP